MHKESCNITTLSIIPVNSVSHKKRFWNLSPEIIRNVRYNYVPMINLPLIKNIIVFLYCFFKISFWNLFMDKSNKLIICDALNLSQAAAALLACKITNKNIIAIITDLPNMMVANSSKLKSKKIKLYQKLNSKLLSRFSGYILLTEQMNKVVNLNQKPYMIMEGLVDISMETFYNTLENKSSKRILIYAGGIYEKYGIKKLINAFMLLEANDLQLQIYGPGEMAEDMPYYCNLDHRIKYLGIVPNDEVVKEQLSATLLINPRPTEEEFTKYSFPSKNMEYMASGTPLVTTLLPGMPKEYLQYVYFFEDESIEGMYKTLNFILTKQKDELHYFGSKAKDFVLNNKSNFIQSLRLINFFETI
jgi:glycosyltransferase involved in cell wall biosynthesis